MPAFIEILANVVEHDSIFGHSLSWANQSPYQRNRSGHERNRLPQKKLTGIDASARPEGEKSELEILRIFESDRGRIINSPRNPPPCSRKRQVFPLERNAAVRTRLTHSLEVQQVGRYIAKEILSRLKEQKALEKYGLDELTRPV
ncbi:Deoxyguanosinetriphosphate triphosphohydrolase [Cedecea neteri]|uniref:Deoxyguanosinetriphosphate triphosphohydrolase n=1 Tax=Cedecea neteri TaxID=158822 RepID=A0A2X2SZ98_9ENTR|nr:Deoxyguanosinetriphosphate triphosphohydrolase [Cedecea neteri]